MSRRKRNSLVKRTFSQDKLSGVCTLPETEFAGAYGLETVKVDRHGPNDFYCFKDNGASVLAVAHLDTVVEPKDRTARFASTKSGPVVTSGALDDRLGAYIVLDLLPELGITYDVLLTTGEESGLSTAECFEPSKDYDWMIEFDRGGTDVVMYQYDDDSTRRAVRASGAVTGPGIFSDICYLEHLNIKGFNWGVGYRDYHSPRGHAYLNETFSMVEKYRRFHALHAGTAMPHEKQAKAAWYESYREDGGYTYREGSSYSYLKNQERTCWYCGEITVDVSTGYCDECTACQDCGDFEADCTCWQRGRNTRLPLPAASTTPRVLPAFEEWQASNAGKLPAA